MTNKMTGRSLRRSRRSTPRSKASMCSVGDIVEIVRHGAPLEGRLVYLLSEGQTPNPRWLVTFDKESHKDEELYEKAFRKLITKAKTAAEEEKPPPRRVRPVLNATLTVEAPGKKASNTSNTPSLPEDEPTFVTFANTETPAQSDESSSEGPDQSLSARERRSQRRRAKTKVEIAQGVVNTMTATASSMTHNDSNNLKRNRSSKNASTRNKRQKTESSNAEDEVVKVKILTGTLYLYRGLKRHAKFVRRV